MLRLATRSSLIRRPFATQFKRLASAAVKAPKQVVDSDLVDQLERDARRILRVVERRVEEREKLLKEDMAETAGGSTEQIRRARALKESEPLHEAWTRYLGSKQVREETEVGPLLDDPDPEIRSMAVEERTSLTSVLSDHLSTTFPSLLLPTSSTKHFSALIELKPGVGGDESALFVSSVLKMYDRLATQNNYTMETISASYLEGSKGSGGGMKEAIVEVKGEGAYDLFRWESGVHRVQRVPATETQGRVHTSTITVIVLPTSEESQESDSEFKVDEKDVKTEVMRSRGAGGQHVNKTESAVRLTHIPTGITVSMQDSRSQHSNRAKAWQILRARLLDRKLTEEMQKRRDVRQSIVRSADRSEKIRTYNFPQDRLTDHRIGMTISNLDAVFEGDHLRMVIDELQREHEESTIEDMLNE
ncbi:hypothetical protein FRB94_009931 [Tulasnella sp. JGI-2019a]|nr:hypothetical protein FRB94_009931 [Tulasnella sp. JGI-2019a]